MAYAIIATGGKQLRVEPGRFYDVDRLAVDEDDSIVLDQVLLVENAGTVSVGRPLVEGATVSATVMSHLRGRKIIVYKMRPKKKTRKKQGHRQELTRLMITGIDVGGSTISSVNDSANETETETDVADAVDVKAVEAEVVGADD